MIEVLAHIFRPTRQRKGKRARSRYYVMRWKLHGESKWQRVCLGVSDQAVAEARMREFVREHEQEAAGIITPRPLRDGAQRTIAGHLGEFVDHLESSGRTVHYRNIVSKRCGKVFDACGWKLLRDVTPESFDAWRAGSKLAPKTLNHYLGTLLVLLNWLKRRGRLVANPLASVAAVALPEGDSSVRALSDAEMTRLLDAAGPRRLAYLLAVTTGLRRAELGALDWSDVRLDAVRPFLRVRGATTKSGKSANQPLCVDAVDALRAAVGAVQAGPVLPSGVPSMKLWRRDLKGAGIGRVDADGRRVVFHSLRHTFATNLNRAGVAPRVAMELMRHSEIALTMRTYTDRQFLPIFDAMEQLPRFSAPESLPVAAVATGTDGRLSNAKEDAHHDAHRVVKSSLRVSTPVDSASALDAMQTLENKADSLHLAVPVTPCQSVRKMSAVGIEPTTRRLKVCCSTN